MDIDYSPTGREFVTGSYDRTVIIPFLSSFLVFIIRLSCSISAIHLLMPVNAYCRSGFSNIMVVTAEKYITLRECKGQLTYINSNVSMLLI